MLTTEEQKPQNWNDLEASPQSVIRGAIDAAEDLAKQLRKIETDVLDKFHVSVETTVNNFLSNVTVDLFLFCDVNKPGVIDLTDGCNNVTKKFDLLEDIATQIEEFSDDEEDDAGREAWAQAFERAAIRIRLSKVKK